MSTKVNPLYRILYGDKMHIFEARMEQTKMMLWKNHPLR